MVLKKEIAASAKTYIVIGAAFTLLFAAVALVFVFAIPPFENPDELGHLGYLIYIAQHGHLPNVLRPDLGVYDQEAVQPPLYYASAAPALMHVPQPVRPPGDPAFRFVPGPPGAGLHRLFLPITAASSPALQAMADACRRVRIINIAWGLLAAIAAACFLWLLAKRNTAQAVLGFAIFLFNPRWIEAVATVGNDVAATATATITLVFLLHLLTKEEVTFGDSTLLGLACAIAVLTKLNNLGLVLIALIAPAWKARRRGTATLLYLVAVTTPLVPWMVRNHLLYGNLLALGFQTQFVGSRPAPLGVFDFFQHEFQGFRWSYFAVFGQFGVLADAFIYPVLDLFLLISGTAAIVAFIADLRSSQTKFAVLLPFLWTAVIFVEFLIYNRTLFASQGRLIYPAAACIAHIIARGWMFIVPAKAHAIVAVFISALFMLFAFYVAFSVLPRAY